MRQYLDTRHYNMPFKNVAVQGFGALTPNMPATVADVAAAQAELKSTALLYAGGAVAIALVADWFFSRRRYMANRRRSRR